MAILGIVTTQAATTMASTSATRDPSVREKIFYNYPVGKSPIMGILSKMGAEETNSETIKWFEKNYKERVTLTATNGGAGGPFLAADGTSDPGAELAITNATSPAAQTEYTVVVDSSELFRVGHVIMIRGLTANDYAANAVAADASNEWKGVVTAIISSTKIKFRPISTPTRFIAPLFVDNDSGENLDKEVRVIGSAFAAGVTNQSQGIYLQPFPIYNYSQVFRTPIGIDGRSLVTPVQYDRRGMFPDVQKDASIQHMIEIENAVIFGERGLTYVAASPVVPSSGVPATNGLPTYTMGGILYFMQLWEAGSAYSNTAATADTDDNKRIIANTSGEMTWKKWTGYMERIFRGGGMATANELIAFCGTKFLQTMEDMFEGRSCITTPPTGPDTFGMDIVTYRCSWGRVHFTTHPLFSLNDTLRYNALFMNPNNIKYRYYTSRDTHLRLAIHTPGMDGREDEWFTDCSMEIHAPQAFMYMQNVQNYVP